MSKRLTQLVLSASALGCALFGASQASAGTVAISADQLATTSYIVTLGGVVDGKTFNPLSVYESPDILTASFDGGAPVDVLVFCVDIFHTFDSSTPPVTYQTGFVTTDSDGTTSGTGVALSHVLSGELGYLADLGQATSDAARLAGIQGAIWETEYSGLTISGGSSFVGYYAGLASAWGAAHPDFAGYATGIYSTGAGGAGLGTTQGFTTGGVPEPASWALLIAGFGLVGASLRGRRRGLASA